MNKLDVTQIWRNICEQNSAIRLKSLLGKSPKDSGYRRGLERSLKRQGARLKAARGTKRRGEKRGSRSGKRQQAHEISYTEGRKRIGGKGAGPRLKMVASLSTKGGCNSGGGNGRKSLTSNIFLPGWGGGGCNTCEGRRRSCQEGQYKARPTGGDPKRRKKDSRLAPARSTFSSYAQRKGDGNTMPQRRRSIPKGERRRGH